MKYFLNSNEEIDLIKFIAKYQYLSVNDTKYFFSSGSYYKKRITKLIQKGFLTRTKLKLVLGKMGIEYVKLFNFKYNRLNRNTAYVKRLMYISHLAAFYYNCNTVDFVPSFSIKDKEVLTITGRRYVRKNGY